MAIGSGIGIYTSRINFENMLKGKTIKVGHQTLRTAPTPTEGVCGSEDLWLAFEKRWQGFFHTIDINFDTKEIILNPKSWHQLIEPDISQEHFSGTKDINFKGKFLMRNRNNNLEIVTINDDFGNHCELPNTSDFPFELIVYDRKKAFDNYVKGVCWRCGRSISTEIAPLAIYTNKGMICIECLQKILF